MKIKSQYLILDLIGTGQFGRVFSALNLKNGQLVALKELEKKSLTTSKFLQEFSCLTLLDHPHIVTCQGLEHNRNCRYLVMDYCEGGTLRNLINAKTQLNLIHSLEIIIQILSAAQYAHNQGIIHRDIKPENILLSLTNDGWVAHLSDFGIAELPKKTNQYGLGITGSPAYMAPERFYGQYSYSCDLYAIGIVLFELIVGKPPFLGTPKELQIAHLNQPVIIPNTVPFILRKTITKALAKLPHLRFSQAETMQKYVKLAQEVLKATQQNTCLFREINNFAINDLTSIFQTKLAKIVKKIIVNQHQLYLVNNDCLQLISYSDNNIKSKSVQQSKTIVKSIIKEVNLQLKGFLVVSKTEKHYILQQSILPDYNQNQIWRKAKDLLFATNLNYLIVAYLNQNQETVIFEKLHLPSLRLLRSWYSPPQLFSEPVNQNWNLLPQKIILFNLRYGLACYFNKQQSRTSLQIFNHCGKWIGNFELSICLDLITPNIIFQERIFALDVHHPNTGLLINLKPFQVTRVALQIKPNFAIADREDFILSDREGKIVVFNTENLTTRLLQLSLTESEQVTAISCTAQSELLVATWSESQGRLYHLQSYQPKIT